MLDDIIGNKFKLAVGIASILAILALLIGVYFWGYGNGKDKIQRLWDNENRLEAEAAEIDRSARQGKADSIDESTAKELQDQMVKNADLLQELEDERKKKPYTDCLLPPSGVQSYRKAIQTNGS